MPYVSTRELPASVKDHLPKHAQTIYRKAFNSAYKEYASPSKRRKGGDREETAHRVAWSAVKKEYRKKGDAWVKKKEAGGKTPKTRTASTKSPERKKAA